MPRCSQRNHDMQQIWYKGRLSGGSGGVKDWRRVRGRQSHKGREEGTEEDRTQREERGGGDGSGGDGSGEEGGGGGRGGEIKQPGTCGNREPVNWSGERSFYIPPAPGQAVDAINSC